MGRQGSRDRRSSNRSNQNKRYGSARKSTLEERHRSEVETMDGKANQRFSSEPAPMGFPTEMEEPRTFSFDWTLSPVPLSSEEQVAGAVMRRGEFGWVEDERLDEIAAFVEDQNMSLDQALSLRSALLQQKTVYSHGKLKSKARQMAAKYREGATIVELSKDFDFPPMNVFRVVLEANGWSKKKIKESLRSPSSMKQREQDEFKAAEAADRVSNVDQSETQVRADLFEDILSDWFDRLPNLTFYKTPIPSEGRLIKSLKGVFFWNKILKKEKFDLFEGFNLPMVKNRYGKTVMTIHDLRGLKDEYSLLYQQIFKAVLNLSFYNADHIITGSKEIEKED